MNSLKQIMKNLSLDGVFRTLFAFATAAGYQADVPFERRLRSAMPKAQQTIAMSIAVGTKLMQQKRFSLTSSPSVLIDLLKEVSAEFSATAIDISVAQSLLGAFQGSKLGRATRQVSQSQLVLF